MPRPKKRSPRPVGATIDAYLAKVRPEQRAALEKLRKQIHAAAPGVEECISYSMPGFRWRGRMLVWFGATSKHCAFYPGGIAQEFQGELQDFDISKGTVRFQPEHPLPAAMVKKLVKARMARLAEK